MYDHTKLEGIGSTDIYENLDCLVFRFGLIFSSAFHLPGGTQGGYFFQAVLLKTHIYFFFRVFTNTL